MPGWNTGVGSCSLLQEIFPTQGSNPGLQHCRQIHYQLGHKGSPRTLEWIAYPFSRGSSRPRNQTGVSCIAGGFFTSWAPRLFDCVDHNKLWEILKEMGILDHLICLLINLYAGQKSTWVGHETTDWFKIGKKYVKAVYCHPAYLTYMQSTNAELDESQAWIKNAGRNNNLRYADDTTLMQKAKRNSRATWGRWKWRVKKLA